ncbi:hypothetical protein [Streptomyces atratus]|uniref:hypothetical protein n=1 Tax=Streptomyces atratus TaxID=1893 RepID=UPI0036499E6F
MANDFELMKLYTAGLTDDQVAAKLQIPVEEAIDRAFRMGLSSSVSKRFSTTLREWRAKGFVEPGWNVRLDRSEGSYRIRFRMGADAYDLTETQMEWFIVGAQHGLKFRPSQGSSTEGEVQ